MAFSIDRQKLEEYFEKVNPDPNRKEKEWAKSNWLSMEDLVKVTENNIQRAYEEGGMDAVHEMRDIYKDRLDLVRIEGENDFYVEEFFKVILRRIYHFKIGLKNKKYSPNEGETSNGGQKKITPESVATKIKEDTRSRNSPYSKEEIIFVLKVADEYQDEKNVSKLVRNIRALPGCPENLKSRPEKDYKPESRWIKKFDREAGFSRTPGE